MRRFLIVCGIGTVLFTAAVFGYFALLGDRTTPLDLDVAGAPVGAAGDPGVYVYRTAGFETVDALAGARHDYPLQTFLTIAAGECGPVVRWDALEERWIEWHHCGDGGAITATLSFHRWFGVADLEEERCEPPLPLAPAVRFTVVCSTDDTEETYTIEPLGAETRNVAGESVSLDRVRVTSEVAGATTGWSRADLWVLPGTLLVVRTEVERHTVTPSAIGDISYEESYTLELTSLQPGAGPG